MSLLLLNQSTGTPGTLVYVIGSAIFVSDEVADVAWPLHTVGLIDGELWVAVDVPPGTDPSDGAAIDLRDYYGMVPEHHWYAAGRAVQIVEWARTHRFCGRCATPTESADGDRSMDCPKCGLSSFPRLSPAMITLITRGEPGPDQEILLAHGANWPTPMYSCLAGFVEPGEALEDCVIREVREEVCLEVRNPRYFGSQPWPFPNSLMIGFTAEYESGDIDCDVREVDDAGWFRRDDLPMIPPSISIAHQLIVTWRDSVAP